MIDRNLETANHPECNDRVTSATESSSGVSPYATGGGGVTFERKVAVQYLAHLLVRDAASEFGEGRHAVSVAFQQAPDYPVDDLVVQAARDDELEASLSLALAVRRSLNLVASDERALKLMLQFVRAVIDGPVDGVEDRLGLVVSGTQPHAEHLNTLAGLAAVQIDAPGFFNLIRTQGKFDAGVRDRLNHIERLVEHALKDLGVAELDAPLVQRYTWQLLSRLVVLMPRLESPDDADWSVVENSLVTVARTSDLAGAAQLRDRLVAMASEYSPKAARVDRTILRRDTHHVLNPQVRRHEQGWRLLDHLHGRALALVRNRIATVDASRHMSLDRSNAERRLIAATVDSAAVLVSGESGVGKSALALRSLTAASEENPDVTQALCINLRHIHRLPIEFASTLGCPLSTLLCELSAPQRVLVVDGADAVTEGMEDAFRYIVGSAEDSGVTLVVVTAMDSLEIVRRILADCLGSSVAEHTVEPLTDEDLTSIATSFPEIESLNANPRSRELLRRLVVVDLLVRGNLTGIPLSDADAMREVWSGLVRRHEKSDRGLPDARESVLLQLANLSLSGGDRHQVISSFDAAAVSGLRHDGLLPPSAGNPSMVGPDFAHDEVRRYAVARLLMIDGDPASRLSKAGAPRWTLGAARLACQVKLGEPDGVATPLRGRFSALQASFDALVEAGHESRWSDVPGEALLTLGDSTSVLRDAWPSLLANDSAGLRRLARLVNQRLRGDDGLVNHLAIEPIIALLLEDDAPWRSADCAYDLLREWLYGHAFAGTPAGHPLRTLLREGLVEACAEADRRLAEQQKEATVASPPQEEDEQEHFFGETPGILSIGISYGVRARRQRPKIPRECRDDEFLQLLALLGPDLGDEGEAILRRLAQDAPQYLGPAVDELLTGLALARYERGLLAHLTQAYYLDDEANRSSFFDDGIRPHCARSVGVLPLAAWYRGPFRWLFRSDFSGGVAVLNRLLNHAALTRVHTLAGLRGMSQDIPDIDVGQLQAELHITGTPRVYLGDAPVWMSYRGTGIGPNPCVSALQALERECDRLIKAGIPIKALVAVLLDGCESLAMVGLVVGLLVRHLEPTGDSLDPYFTEPLIWEYEFRRVASEGTGFADNSDGIAAQERRKWSLREAAMAMVMSADDERAAGLRALGETLVETARREMEQGGGSDDGGQETDGREEVEAQLAMVRNWASILDRSNLQVHETPEGLYVQSTTPREVVEALQLGNEELERAAEQVRLTARYYVRSNGAHAEAIKPDELAADLASARRLLESQPDISTPRPWDAPTLVAAASLEAYLLRRTDLPDDLLTFAADTVLRVLEGAASPRPHDFEDTYFEQGADRSAARVLSLLLMPNATRLRTLVDGTDGSAALTRISAAGLKAAQAVASEVRLHLARGLDHLWAAPCSDEEPCHHRMGWRLATEAMRDCVMSRQTDNIGMHRAMALKEPFAKSLARTPDDLIMPSRIDASIRALAPAATANICVSSEAHTLLMALLAAQRRGLLQYKGKSMDQRGTHSLVSARAALTLAQHGNDSVLFEHVDAYADNSALLNTHLRALSAAAEETPGRAAVARRIWPSLIRHVLDLHEAGHAQFDTGYSDEGALVALIPNPAVETAYLYRELQEKPIAWWEPLTLQAEVEAWLVSAVGHAACVDQLIFFLRVLTPEEQARVGLPWVAKLVLASPSRIAKGSFLVTMWLTETCYAASTVGLSAKWQEVVDALVTEGNIQLAPYSE